LRQEHNGHRIDQLTVEHRVHQHHAPHGVQEGRLPPGQVLVGLPDQGAKDDRRSLLSESGSPR
jgi:hypothetical protein